MLENQDFNLTENKLQEQKKPIQEQLKINHQVIQGFYTLFDFTSKRIDRVEILQCLIKTQHYNLPSIHDILSKKIPLNEKLMKLNCKDIIKGTKFLFDRPKIGKVNYQSFIIFENRLSHFRTLAKQLKIQKQKARFDAQVRIRQKLSAEWRKKQQEIERQQQQRIKEQKKKDQISGEAQ